MLMMKLKRKINKLHKINKKKKTIKKNGLKESDYYSI